VCGAEAGEQTEPAQVASTRLSPAPGCASWRGTATRDACSALSLGGRAVRGEAGHGPSCCRGGRRSSHGPTAMVPWSSWPWRLWSSSAPWRRPLRQLPTSSAASMVVGAGPRASARARATARALPPSLRSSAAVQRKSWWQLCAAREQGAARDRRRSSAWGGARRSRCGGPRRGTTRPPSLQAEAKARGAVARGGEVGPARSVAHDGEGAASSAPGRETRRSARLPVPRCGGKNGKTERHQP
jgi:hypothetical protein